MSASENSQGNMPGDYDSTSSGGYGTSANVWSQRAQRGFDNTNPASANAMGPSSSTTTDPDVTELGRSGIPRDAELPSHSNSNFDNGSTRERNFGSSTSGHVSRHARGSEGDVEGTTITEAGRGNADGNNRTGLVDQSLSGGDLRHEMQDARWGEKEVERGEGV